MAFLLTLAVVYVVGAFWDKLVSSGAAPANWLWPVQLVKKLYDKLNG